MFGFSGTISRRDYAFAAAWRVALFAAVTAGYPVLLSQILQISYCAWGESGCSALAVAVARYTKPVIFIVFLALMTGITVRRVRDLALPGYFGFLLPALLLADWRFQFLILSRWFGFVIGNYIAFPRYLHTVLVCVVFLSLVEGAQGDERPDVRFGRLGKAALLLICFIAAAGVMQFVTVGIVMMLGRSLMTSIMMTVWWIGILALFAIIILAALLGILAWRDYSRRGNRAGSQSGGNAPERGDSSPQRTAFGQRRK